LALGGFLICAFLWFSLSWAAKLYGAAWLSIGFLWFFHQRRQLHQQAS
jgi:hypothetical protein